MARDIGVLPYYLKQALIYLFSTLCFSVAWGKKLFRSGSCCGLILFFWLAFHVVNLKMCFQVRSSRTDINSAIGTTADGMDDMKDEEEEDALFDMVGSF